MQWEDGGKRGVDYVTAGELACERGSSTEGTFSRIDVQDEERLAIMKRALYILFFYG